MDDVKFWSVWAFAMFVMVASVISGYVGFDKLDLTLRLIEIVFLAGLGAYYIYLGYRKCYYEIIGHYTGKPIGVTMTIGREAPYADGEPEATFRRISRRQYKKAIDN